jgi:hypothetical protein
MFQFGDIIYMLINNKIVEATIIDIFNHGNGKKTLRYTVDGVTNDYHHIDASQAYLTIDSLLTGLVRQFDEKKNQHTQEAA